MGQLFVMLWSRLVMSREERNLLLAMCSGSHLSAAAFISHPAAWTSFDGTRNSPSKFNNFSFHGVLIANRRFINEDLTRRLYPFLPADEEFKELDFALSATRYADALRRLETSGLVQAFGAYNIKDYKDEMAVELYALTAAGLETAMELWNSDEGGHRLSAQETPDENVEG